MKLKIAHTDVDVAAWPREAAETADASGQFEPATHTIRIDESLCPAEQARVLIHEVIHACFWCFKIQGKRFDEEAVCSNLDVPLATVFRDNPELGVLIHLALNHGVRVI